MARGLTKWLLIFVVASACVDPISFHIPDPADMLVVDGHITDQAGPYTVRILKGNDVLADSTRRIFVGGVKIKLHDDLGAVENFKEVRKGVYMTDGTIRGTVGRTYHITMELPDGNTLQSDPETMYPSGVIGSITHEYEPRTSESPFGTLRGDVFNIYVDGNAPVVNGIETYLRWRFTGTFKVVTHPELHMTNLQSFWYRTPFPCSGFTVDPAEGGGILRQRDPCTCCECWVKQYETEPRLSDTDLVTNGQFRNIKVGDVPINNGTFSEKYKIEVEQMAISKTAFEFFKLIRAQKQATNNLFQPAPGKLVGNIHSSNSEQLVVGIFWAASVSKKVAYLTPDMVPYPLAPETIVIPCYDYYANTTLTKPVGWDE